MQAVDDLRLPVMIGSFARGVLAPVVLLTMILVPLMAGCGGNDETAPPAPAAGTDKADGNGESRVEGAADRPGSGDPPPIITFDELQHDFGVRYTLEKPETVFTFRNEGGSDLLLKRVKSSCTSCTVAEYTKEPIPPGGEGELKVSLTSSKPGKSRKHIDVYSNASNANNSSTRLTVQATFKDRIWVEPTTIQMGRITQGLKFPRKRVKVSWLKEKPLEIISIETSYPDLVTATSAPFEDNEKAGITIDLTFGDPQLLMAQNEQLSHIFGSVVIKTTDSVHETIVVRFSGEVLEQVVVMPRTLVLRRDGDGGITQEGPLKLAGAPNAAIIIEKNECTLPFLDVTIDEKTKGVMFHVTMSTNGTVPPGRQEGTLTLHTNFERQPRFIIPVLIPEAE